MIFLSEARVSITEHSQPKGVEPNKRERKLRSGVNRQGALKQKRLKQGLHVLQCCKGKGKVILLQAWCGPEGG